MLSNKQLSVKSVSLEQATKRNHIVFVKNILNNRLWEAHRLVGVFPFSLPKFNITYRLPDAKHVGGH